PPILVRRRGPQQRSDGAPQAHARRLGPKVLVRERVDGEQVAPADDDGARLAAFAAPPDRLDMATGAERAEALVDVAALDPAGEVGERELEVRAHDGLALLALTLQAHG